MAQNRIFGVNVIGRTTVQVTTFHVPNILSAFIDSGANQDDSGSILSHSGSGRHCRGVASCHMAWRSVAWRRSASHQWGLVNGGFGKAPNRPKINPKLLRNVFKFVSQMASNGSQEPPGTPRNPIGTRRNPQEPPGRRGSMLS